MRKDRSEGAQDHVHDVITHFINVEPLRHDTACFKSCGSQFVIFAAKNAAHTCHPRVGRLAYDHIISGWIQFQDGARIFHEDTNARVGHYSGIPFFKQFSGAENGLTVFCDVQFVDGMSEERSSANAASKAHDKDFSRVRAREDRKMSDEHLR